MLTSKDEKYFTDLLDQIRSDVQDKLPVLDDPSIFLAACRSVQNAQHAFDAARIARDKADDDHKKQAQECMDAAELTLNSCIDTGVAAAAPLINALPSLNDATLDTQLVTCSVLVEATPKYLADFCTRGPECEELIDELLSDPSIMKEFLQAGGAKGGKYGHAMEIYVMLGAKDINDEVLYKLAVGVSVELADGLLNEFDTTTPVDPVARFQHYQQAYQNGELDADFDSFTTFEMRYVINSNAPNDQLAWGRAMLRNYRPDEVELTDRQWRYVRSVRTDVPYKHPEWTGTPHTYAMIISGGGECGPRAWFGRFILQAFGIPIWGVRQPGHAALTHWTPTGWVVCLGATWKFCTWEGRWGPDFLLETQARSCCGEDKYLTVLRLEWIANVLGDPPLDKSKSIVNPDSLWGSLALMQKKILSTKPSQPALSTRMLPRSVPLIEESPTMDEFGTLMIIQATSCRKPDKSTNNVIFMKSYLGGQQLHHLGGDTVEYSIDVPDTKTYSLTVLVVTVHRDTENTPMLLTIENEDTTSITPIPIPYTIGMWQETEAVSVELTKGTNVMRFTRETPNSGLTLKYFKFRAS